MSKTLLSVLAAMAMAGCVGSLEPTPPGGGDDTTAHPDAGTGTVNEAKPLFDNNVYPIIQAKCMSCHSAAGPAGNVTGFVATTAAQGYATITGYTAVVGNFTTATAGILGMPASGTSPHTATMESAADIAAITAWLDKEAQIRSGGNAGSGSGTGTGSGSNPGNETPSEATTRLLKQWSGCMTQTNFDTANMAQGWGNMTTTNNQQCENCHVNGAEGMIASRQSVPFFTTIDTNKYYMLQYFTVDLTQGTAAAKIIINTTSFDGVRQGQDPHREHPRFTLQGSSGMTALQSFYDLTSASLAAGTCGPSTLTN